MEKGLHELLTTNDLHQNTNQNTFPHTTFKLVFHFSVLFPYSIDRLLTLYTASIEKTIT